MVAKTGSKLQNVNVTDLICEGPIWGPVDGLSSIYLDDTSVQDGAFKAFIPVRSNTSGRAVISRYQFNNSAGVSKSSYIATLDEDFPEGYENFAAQPRSLVLTNYLQADDLTVSSLVSSDGYQTWRVKDNSGSPFTSDQWNTSNKNTRRAYVTNGNIDINGEFVRTNSQSGVFTTSREQFIDSRCTWSLVQQRSVAIRGVNHQGNANELRLNRPFGSDLAEGTYNYYITPQPNFSYGDSSVTDLLNWSYAQKIDNLQVDFRRGTVLQTPFNEVGGVGGSISENGNLNTISVREIKMINRTYASDNNIFLYDVDGLPNIDGYEPKKAYPGSPDYDLLATGPTILTPSTFGLTTDGKLAEADEIFWSIRYDSFQVVNLNKGKREDAYAFYVMQIRFKSEDSADFGPYRNIFPNAGNLVKHKGNTQAPIEFEHVLNLNQFRPFADFEIRIVRVTRHVGIPVRSDGTSKGSARDIDGDKEKWQTNATAKISQVGAIIKDRLRYPYTSMASMSFNARDYDDAPKRSYELRGLLVKIPDTYLPREYTTDGVAEYSGFWDGTFRNELYYTDNPAWVFYDIVTNNRYGAGRWVDASQIDKFALYRVARYCDELVDDGNGGTEPRFRANVFLTKPSDVYKILKDFATIFLGILYWQDSKLVALQDAPSDPVYTFTKGNVINGEFSYESSGARTRTNQVIVTWNDPDSNYASVPLVVEDRNAILNSGRIISEDAVAFGATSEGQAIRYGRWKLWTAQNQTEIVNFKTSLAAHFIKPGDVINVQDADRYGVQYSGRIKSASAGGITIDRTVNFDGASDYELSTLVTEGAAFLADSDPLEIGGVTYQPGQRVPSAYINGSSSLVSIDSSEDAANAYTTQAATTLAPLLWKEYTYVQTNPVTSTISGDTNQVTVSGTFAASVSAGTIWALKEIQQGSVVNGSRKEYRVLSVAEDSPNEFSIAAVEYYDEKYQAVDKDYALGYLPSTIYARKEPDTIPPPRNLIALLASDEERPGEELVLEWSPPLPYGDDPSVNYVTGYEVILNVEGQPQIQTVKEPRLELKSLPNGDFIVAVRSVSARGNVSRFISLPVKVYDIYSKNVPRLAGGFPQGGVSSSPGGVIVDTQLSASAAAQFLFQDADYVLVGAAATGNYQTPFEFSQSIGVLPSRVEAYLAFDSSESTLKLIKYEKEHLPELSYYRDLGAGNRSISANFTALSTGISISADSTVVRGVGFSAEVLARDVLLIDAPLAESYSGYGLVTAVVSDTELRIDRTFDFEVTNVTGRVLNYRPDYENDAVLARIEKNSQGAYNYDVTKYFTVDPSLSSQRAAIVKVTPTFFQYTGSTAAVTQINEPDDIIFEVFALGFSEPEFRITSTSGIGFTDMTSFSAGNVDRFTYRVTVPNGAVAYDNNSVQSFTASVKETANVSFFEKSATYDFPKIRDGIEGPRGGDGAAGSDGRTVSLTANTFAFRYDQDGNRVDQQPIATVISASAFGLSSDAVTYFEFFRNDVSIESASTKNTFEYFQPTSIDDMPEKIEVALRRDNATNPIIARDQITMFGLQPGTDSFTVILTNEAHSMPQANSDGGNTIDYTGAGTDIRVFRGQQRLTYTTSEPSNSQFRVTATPTNISIGNITSISNGARLADTSISSMTANTAQIEYTISSGALLGSISRIQSFSRSIEGENGSLGVNARAVSLSTTTLAFVYDENGLNPTPSSINIEANAIETINNKVFYEFLVGDTSEQNTESNVYEYTPTASADRLPQTIQVNVRESQSTGQVLASDIITVYGLVPGSDAYTVVSPNLAHVFSASVNGAVTSFANSGTTFEVYKGATPLTFKNTATIDSFSISTSSNTIAVPTLTGLNTSVATLPDYTSFSADRAQASVEFIIDVEGKVDYRLIQSLAKSKTGSTGAVGANGRTVSISATKLAVQYDEDGQLDDTANTVFTATAFTEVADEDVYYQWFINNSAQGTPSNATGANQLIYSNPNVISTLPQTVKVEIRESASSNPVVAFDSETIFGIQPGKGAYFVSFANGSHVVSASSDGTVETSDLGNSGVEIRVYKGGDLLSFSSDEGAGAFSITKQDNGVVSGGFTGQGTTTATQNDIVSFSADKTRAEVIFTISADNAASFVLQQNITKSRRGFVGPEGQAGRTVSIEASNLALTFDADGNNPDRDFEVFTATAFNTTGTVYYDFTVNGSSIQNDQSNTFTYSTSELTYNEMPKNIGVKIRESGSAETTVVAQDSVAFVGLKPGQTGGQANFAFFRKATQPSADGTGSLPLDDGITQWSDTPPTTNLDLPLWISKGNRAAGSSVWSWSTPYRADADSAAEIYFYSDVQTGAAPSFTAPTYDFVSNSSSVPANWNLSPPDLTATGQKVYVIVVLYVGTPGDASATAVSVSNASVYSERKDGDDAYTLVFPNSTHTFTANRLGVVSDYTNSGTTFQVYRGTDALTFANSEAANSFAITANATSISSGGLTGQGTTTATVGPHNDYVNNSPTAKIDYTISVDNAITILATQTFSISKTGDTGTGDPGLRRQEGYIYYQTPTNTAPTVTGSQRYEFATDSFSAVTGSTLSAQGWERQPPNNLGTDGQFWISRWFVEEESSGAGQGTTSFETSRSTTNFTDVVIISDLVDGGSTVISGDNIQTGSITLSSGAAAAVKSGKTGYSDTTAGFFLGMDGNTPKFAIGDSGDSLRWTGSTLEVTGNISASVLNVTDATVLGELQATSLAAGTVTTAALSQGVLNLIDGRIESAINATSPGYYLVNNNDTQKITSTNPTYTLGSNQTSNGLSINLSITAAHYWSGSDKSNRTGTVAIQSKSSDNSTWTTRLTDSYTISKTLVYSYAGIDVYSYGLFINASGTVQLNQGVNYDWRVVCSGADTNSPLALTGGDTPFEASVVEGSSGVISTGGTTTSSNFSESARFARSAGQAATAVFSNSANYAQSAGFAAVANVSNSAAEAGKWTDSRTITFTGDATGSFSIDGSADVSGVTLTVSGGEVGTANFSKSSNFSRSANYAQSAGFAAVANVSNSAAEAGKWKASKTVTFAGGDATGSFSIDGSSNVNNVVLTVSGGDADTANFSKSSNFSRSANYAQSAGNAAQLGGIAAANYLRSDTDDSTTGSLTFANNKGVKFLANTGSSDATSYLYRAGGNATRFQYFKNSFIFDAKEDNAFEIRNSADVANFTLTPNTTLTNAKMYFSGEAGIGISNPDKPLVVYSSTEPEIVIGHTVNKGTPRIRFRNGATAASSIALVYATSSSIYLENKAGDQLILNGAGKAQVFESGGGGTNTLLDVRALATDASIDGASLQNTGGNNSFIGYDAASNNGTIFHKDLSNALTSPVNPGPLIDLENNIFKFVGDIGHVEGHISSVTITTLDFGDTLEITACATTTGTLDIKANSITANKIAASTITGTEISASAFIKAGGGTNIGALRGTGDPSDDTEVRIFAGASVSGYASAPFRVTQGGELTATNAIITGSVTTDTLSASGGTIGGFTITRSSLYAGVGTYNNSNTPVYISSGQSRFSLGNKLSWNGTTLSINGNGTFTGNVTTDTLSASGGTIGGFTITRSSLFTGTQNQGGGYSANGITIRSNGVFSTPNFYVGSGGNAFFRGTITASAGEIASFTITKSSLYSGTGTYGASNTPIYLGATDSKFSLGNKLAFTSGNLSITGTLTTDTLSASGGVIGGFTITKSSLYSGTGTYGAGNTPIYMGATDGKFSLGDKLTWDGSTLTVNSALAANSVTATQIEANSITGNEIAANTITASEMQADSITASSLQISNNSGGNAGIFFDNNGGSPRIDIHDGTNLRVRIGYLPT